MSSGLQVIYCFLTKFLTSGPQPNSLRGGWVFNEGLAVPSHM